VLLVFRDRKTSEGRTQKNGTVVVPIRTRDSHADLFVLPERGYWARSMPVTCKGETRVELVPLHVTDWAYRAVNGAAEPGDIAPVRVAVIDTGVGPNPLLVVEGGESSLLARSGEDFNDVSGHGTHVAGLIAATSALPFPGGLHPSAHIRAYRIFRSETSESNDADLSNALSMAIRDKCDIINLSLTSPNSDAVGILIEEAIEAGILVVAASGNLGAPGVQYPAAYPGVIAVSAVGTEGSFPSDSIHSSQSMPVQNGFFAARFNSTGPEVQFTAPGVAVPSLARVNGFLTRDGTSMAAPFVTGILARLLASDPDLRMMGCTRARADAARAKLLEHVADLGLPSNVQGHGLVRCG
jgi:subtilisin